MPLRFRFALVLSAAFHLALAISFFFSVLWQRPAPAPPPAVFVDLPKGEMEAAGAAPSGQAKAKLGQRGSRSLGRGQRRASPAMRWRPRPHAWEGGPGESSRESPGSAGGLSEGEGAEARGRGTQVEGFANGLGLKEETKFFPFARAIHRRIDGHLIYPPDFVENNIQGYVTLHFLVDGRGRFLGRFLESDSDDTRLQVYAMAMVAYALEQELPEKLWRPERQIPLEVRVNFRLLWEDDVRGLRPERNFKNLLVFDRVGYTESKFNKAVHRAMVKYMPPIIPLPGGFWVDFVLLYRQLTEQGDNDPHARRQLRMELDQEQLKSLLRKAGNGPPRYRSP